MISALLSLLTGANAQLKDCSGGTLALKNVKLELLNPLTTLDNTPGGVPLAHFGTLYTYKFSFTNDVQFDFGALPYDAYITNPGATSWLWNPPYTQGNVTDQSQKYGICYPDPYNGGYRKVGGARGAACKTVPVTPANPTGYSLIIPPGNNVMTYNIMPYAGGPAGKILLL